MGCGQWQLHRSARWVWGGSLYEGFYARRQARTLVAARWITSHYGGVLWPSARLTGAESTERAQALYRPRPLRRRHASAFIALRSTRKLVGCEVRDLGAHVCASEYLLRRLLAGWETSPAWRLE